MQVSVETKEGLERELTVEFPVSDLNGEMNSRLQSLSKSAKINGFRPGKIPMSVIKKRYSAHVQAEVLNEKLQQTYFEAVKQENLKPAGQPEINLVDTDDKKNVIYKAVFEVYPEIEPGSLADESFEKAVVSIGDGDIDATVDNILKQNQTFTDVDRAIEQGDQVMVDFVGTIDGENFKGNEGKNVPITLGNGQMIDGFEEGILGKNKGDDVTLDLKFPEDYHYKDVAGENVQFAISINAVQEAQLPELNDEFFTKFGVTEGGESAFREEVKKNMQLELDKAIAAKLKDQVMDSILSNNEIIVPKALVQEEAKALAEQMQAQYQVQTQGDTELQTTLFEEQAAKRVSLGMVLAELVKVNDIQASQDQVMERIKEMAVSYENPQEVMDYYMSDKSKLAEVQSFVLEEKIVDWACEQGKVTDKEYSFTEFMNPKQNEQSSAA